MKKCKAAREKLPSLLQIFNDHYAESLASKNYKKAAESLDAMTELGQSLIGLAHKERDCL